MYTCKTTEAYSSNSLQQYRLIVAKGFFLPAFKNIITYVYWSMFSFIDWLGLEKALKIIQFNHPAMITDTFH